MYKKFLKSVLVVLTALVIVSCSTQNTSNISNASNTNRKNSKQKNGFAFIAKRKQLSLYYAHSAKKRS